MTVRQIAEQFGVAPSTVSVVLNNRPGVRMELREKIEAALIENGYTIKNGDSAPQSKSSRRSTAAAADEGERILFIYYKTSDYLAARKDNTVALIINGLNDGCEEEGCQFTIRNATPDTLDSVIEGAVNEGFSGIIILGTEYYDREPRASALNCSIPVVFLDYFFPEWPLNTVNLDNSYGLNQSIDHLVENGHSRIGYIRSDIEYGALRDRANCFYAAMTGRNLYNEDYIVQVPIQYGSQEIQEVIERFIENCEDIPTAFIADNDTIGIAAIQTFQKNGYRIPEDISIIGFDDSSVCTILTPYLTSVRADFREMARAAIARLIEMIRKKPQNFMRILIGTQLIRRQSVAPASR